METEILKLLQKRYACRAISQQPVEEEKVTALLHAARLSASCMNYQPWRFLVLNEPEALEKARKALSDGNYWAKAAPLLLVAFSRGDLDCRPADGRDYFLFDVGMAVQNIMLQATELDLIARPMAGFQPGVIRAEFGIPDDYVVIIMIAVGYKGELETLSDKHRKVSTAPRTRNPLKENFFFNKVPRLEEG